MFICVTHVDVRTKIAGFKRPMRNGPTFPDVKGLNIVWWDESKWPIQQGEYPKFYGTCDDDADTTIDGVVKILTEEEYNALYEIELDDRIPRVVTPRQARLALLQANLLSNVNAAIESLEEPEKTQVKIEWEFASEIRRESPLVKKLANAMQLSNVELNELFVSAAQIGISLPQNPPVEEEGSEEEPT